MRIFPRLLMLCALLMCAAPSRAAEPAAKFPLQDGDIWVMAGDSITAQHLHSNYFEAYCFAHYPQWKFAFRNSGVGGHTIPSTLARFGYDIEAWKPTVVSVELGMNDQGGTPTEKFTGNMKTMLTRIRGVKARPVILSASPINNGDVMGKLGGNKRLSEYAVALKELAKEEKVPYADQFHALIDIWGKNKTAEDLVKAISTIKTLSQSDKVAGVKHLKAFLAEQAELAEQPVSMQGDPVHPGVPGQFMMAVVLLRDLGADGFVSSATIDAAGKVVDSKDCKIDNVSAADGVLSFDRLDVRTPLPIPDEARGTLRLDPSLLNMSKYLLTVTGLKDGNYTLKINGAVAGVISSKDLAAGFNLSSLGPVKSTTATKAGEVSPILVQSKAILSAVSSKEGLVGQWRELSKKAIAADATEETKKQRDALTVKVEEADAKIRAAAQPQKLKFELSPAK